MTWPWNFIMLVAAIIAVQIVVAAVIRHTRRGGDE